MRCVSAILLLLLAAQPGSGQDGSGESSLDDGSQPDEPEAEPEPAKEPPPAREEPTAPRIEPTAENVNRAIDRGVAWLKKAQQAETGSWGPCVAGTIYDNPEFKSKHPCYESGPTSFAIFTLAKCGVPARDPAIKKGLGWLRANHRKKSGVRRADEFATYESASLILMLTALYAPGDARKASDIPTKKSAGTKFSDDDWAWMHERVSHLCAGWTPSTGGRALASCQNTGGGWRYWAASGDQDASATQFVLLALREAVRAGYPLSVVDREVWQDAATAAESFQIGSGGFRYKGDYPWSAGMTAASVASLLICKEQMLLARQTVPEWLDGSVARGMTFLGENFDVERNRYDETNKQHPAAYHYYHLYGLERVGMLSGKTEIGGKVWYTRGATFLLAKQLSEGQWDDDTCMDPEDVLGTCFALLFLKRATPPPAVTLSGD